MKVPHPAIRFRPFSHIPGSHCLLPGSWLSCRVFPARICIYDYSLAVPSLICEMAFEGVGPLKEFTVTQDLEKGLVLVSGFCAAGFFSYQILPLESHKDFSLHFMKVPENGSYRMHMKQMEHRSYFNNEEITLFKSQKLFFLSREGASCEKRKLPARERLFLGCSKAQDWSLALRRQSLQELLPFWYWLAQSLPRMEAPVLLGNSSLQELKSALQQQKREEASQALVSLFLVGFKDLLVPRLFDDSFLGFSLPPMPESSASPLLLLQESVSLIRQLFFLDLPGHLSILPLLPPHFHFGMIADLKTGRGHKISIEWTKQLVRRVWIEAGSDETLTLVFQKPIRQFRMRAEKEITLPNYSEVVLREGTRYLLDHFQK